MIIPDVNVLVYAHDRASARHEVAKHWFEQAMRGQETVGLALVAVLGFIRLLSNPKVVVQPVAPGLLIEIVESWLDQPIVRLVQPGFRHFGLMHGLFVDSQAGANLTTDVHLAAIALEHGATLVSNDTDFQRFPGLKLLNLFT